MFTEFRTRPEISWGKKHVSIYKDRYLFNVQVMRIWIF